MMKPGMSCAFFKKDEALPDANAKQSTSDAL